jgi:hypothetical protein
MRASTRSPSDFIIYLLRHTADKVPDVITEQEQSALGRHQDLHCIKPDYIDPNINVKLYDYIKLQARFSSSSTSPTQKHRQGLH